MGIPVLTREDRPTVFTEDFGTQNSGMVFVLETGRREHKSNRKLA